MSTSSDPAARGPSARWSAVMDLLATRGRLSVADAAQELAVSEATVRRDFAAMAHRQLVSRKHGGVVAAQVAYELPYRYRASQGDDTIARLAQVAAGFVEPGAVVALNGGRTTTAVLRAIADREDLAAEGVDEVTIVTNALNIATEAVLRRNIRCVSLGGVARPESYELTGPLTALVVGQLWFDLAVVGVKAIAVDAGPTCRHEDEAAVVRGIVERSARVIVPASADKLGRRTFASICEIDQVSAVVTDADEDHDEVVALRARGITVHCV